MKIYYNPRLKKLARNLRNNATYSEVVLWNELKGKKLGIGFLRQKPIGNYIVDFYCPKLRMVIEVDGMGHHKYFRTMDRDIKKQVFLENLGIIVLRFNNAQVLNNTKSVVDTIKAHIDWGDP